MSFIASLELVTGYLYNVMYLLLFAKTVVYLNSRQVMLMNDDYLH